MRSFRVHLSSADCWGLGPRPIRRTEAAPSLKAKSDIFTVSNSAGTHFRKHYDRGDLPIVIRHGARCVLEWKASVDSIDIVYFLPLFVDGIREQQNPYRFVSSEGTFQLIDGGCATKILSCVSNLIYPLKSALSTNHSTTIILALRVIQSLTLKSPEIAEALIPFYKQLLPILNVYKSRKRNIGDEIDFAQFKHDGRTLGETIEETLTILEETAGPCASAQIKKIVPTYEHIHAA